MTWSKFLAHALEIAMLLPCAYIALVPIRRWFKYPPRTVYLAAGLSCLLTSIVGGAVCAALNWPSNYLIALCLPVAGVVYCSVSTLDLGKTLFCFLNAMLMGAFATVFTSVLMAPMEAANPYDAFLPVTSFICLVVMEMIVVLFDTTLTVKLPLLIGERVADGAWRLLWIVPLLLTLFLVWANPVDSALLVDRIRAVSLIFLLFMLITFWVVYHLFWRLIINLVQGERLKQERDLFSMERKRYAALHAYMQQTRTMRHDFRHHLMTIDELARSGNTEALISYLAPLVDAANRPSPQLCANLAVDSIAAHYNQQAEEKQARIAWSLNLPERLPIDEPDVCAVLGNLVDNAIKAVSELPVGERLVEVSASMPTDSLLGITVKNPYQGTIALNKRGLPKQTNGEHGIGLMSVNMIAHRHHGTFEVNTQGGRFEVGVLLPTG